MGGTNACPEPCVAKSFTTEARLAPAMITPTSRASTKRHLDTTGRKKDLAILPFELATIPRPSFYSSRWPPVIRIGALRSLVVPLVRHLRYRASNWLRQIGAS